MDCSHEPHIQGRGATPFTSPRTFGPNNICWPPRLLPLCSARQRRPQRRRIATQTSISPKTGSPRPRPPSLLPPSHFPTVRMLSAGCGNSSEARARRWSAKIAPRCCRRAEERKLVESYLSYEEPPTPVDPLPYVFPSPLPPPAPPSAVCLPCPDGGIGPMLGGRRSLFGPLPCCEDKDPLLGGR